MEGSESSAFIEGTLERMRVAQPELYANLFHFLRVWGREGGSKAIDSGKRLSSFMYASLEEQAQADGQQPPIITKRETKRTSKMLTSLQKQAAAHKIMFLDNKPLMRVVQKLIRAEKAKGANIGHGATTGMILSYYPFAVKGGIL